MRIRARFSRGAMAAVVALVVAAIPFVATIPSAYAGIGFGVNPTFPGTMTVGQLGQPASIQISNTSTAPESGGSVTLTALNMVPACGTTFSVANGDCPVASADPGVFKISSTGVGETNTACTGQTFAIAIIDAATGQVGFTSTGGPVVLTAPAGAHPTCVIDFTFDVLKLPTKPVQASAPNTVVTGQVGFSTGTAAVNGASGFGGGASLVTVAKAQPTLATAASASPKALGSAITDTATLTGGANPTGSITFTVFNNSDCAGTPLFTSTKTVTAGSATSDPFTPAAIGTFRFVATYSGDGNNLAAGPTNCSDPLETVQVQPLPQISVTKAANPLTRPEPGGTFTFTVTVSNPSANDPIKITTLTDNIYGNLATRAGSTCGALIGITLAPGQTSNACTFTGDFSGKSGDSQTDVVTVNGVDSNGATATANANAKVTLTPPGTVPLVPAINVTKAANPLSLPQPGGFFTFTVAVNNPSTTDTVKITSLVDNIYGDLATISGSTCKALIGVTLAPGATSKPCSFSGVFNGSAGASQTDTVTVTGVGSGGNTVTATAKATVGITAPAGGGTLAFTGSQGARLLAIAFGFILAGLVLLGGLWWRRQSEAR